MKVILYMATTTNGFIAKEDDNTEFVSEEEWESYKKAVKKAGCIICGRRTYEIALREGNLLTEEGLNVVLTHNQNLKSSHPKVLITTKSPPEIIEYLSQQGFTEAIIGGGGILNSSFLQAGLIDEIYLDVEPQVFGKGVPVFSPASFDHKLEFVESKMLSPKTIQLHYRVKKEHDT